MEDFSFYVNFDFRIVNCARSIGAVGAITTGYGPEGIAYDSGKGEILVCTAGNKTVSVISDVTNAVVAVIPVGGYPYGLAYDSRH